MGLGGERTIAASRYWAPQDPCDRGSRHCTVGALFAGDRWFSKEDRKANVKFLRIRKSLLVNTRFIKEYSADRVVLDNGNKECSNNGSCKIR